MTSTAADLARRKARDENGVGSLANAIPFNKQHFEQLRSECLKTGTLFCDPTFPATRDSLGYNQLGRYSSKTIGVEWMRPSVSRAANHRNSREWVKDLIDVD